MKMLLLALALVALGGQDKPPRALDLLEASGHNYEKSGNGWAVKFEGNNQKEIRIQVVQTESLVVLVTVLVFKADVRDAAGLNDALLHKNDDFDLVKVTIDDDGDYLARMDLPPAGQNGETFKKQLMQMALVTDALKPIVDKYRK